jgi:HSP20 family protein
MFYAPASSVRNPVFAPLWRNGSHARHVNTWLDTALDNVWDSLASQSNKLRLQEDEKAYTLSLDVPGLAKEHVRIEMEGAVLRIQSQDDAPRSLRAAYELPVELDAAASEAKLENGVLTLRLVKLVPASKAVALNIA